MRKQFRLSTRGRIAVVVALTLLAAGLFVGYRQFLGDTDCTVTVGGRSVDLQRDAAQTAAAALAPGGGKLRTSAQATRVVARSTDLSDPDARLVADALTGRAQAALTCRGGGAGTSESDQLDVSGLTDRAARVRSEVDDHFGDPPLGGFAPGGVRTGHMPGSAHYEGRAIDVFFRPISSANQQRGWALAQYLVAQAERLEIDTVIFDGRIWTANNAVQGWRIYRVHAGNRPASVVRVLEHRDHVHVDVAD